MLSIIIITKNEEENLPLLLDSIKMQDYKDYEIIVSDVSTDNTRKIAREYGCKVVDGGLPSKGRNNGAKAAKGDMLLFLDADVRLPESFLSKNLKEIRQRKLDVSTPISVPISDKWVDFLYYSTFNFWAMLTQRIFPHAGGYCIFCKRDLFEKVGGFDEKLKFSEDMAFVNKSKKYGLFRLLKSSPILCSVRRLEKDGRITIMVKFLWSCSYRIAAGEFYHVPFEYELGGIKIKDTEDSSISKVIDYAKTSVVLVLLLVGIIMLLPYFIISAYIFETGQRGYLDSLKNL